MFHVTKATIIVMKLLSSKINVRYIKYIVIIVLGLFWFVSDISIKNKLRKTYNENPEILLFGKIYFRSRLLPIDYDKALDWHIINTRNKDDARAQYNTGLVYDILYNDYANALKWYLKAVKQNLPEAQNNIGFMYLEGRGVAKDCQKAAEWFQKAAEQGYALAQYNLAVMYLNGSGVAKDYEKAYQLHEKASEQNVTFAQYHLWLAYLCGWGVAKDERVARKWGAQMKKSAKNNAEFQYAAGFSHQYGIESIKSISKAKKLYTKAAKQGHVCAKVKLEEISEEREHPLELMQTCYSSIGS